MLTYHTRRYLVHIRLCSKRAKSIIPKMRLELAISSSSKEAEAKGEIACNLHVDTRQNHNSHDEDQRNFLQKTDSKLSSIWVGIILLFIRTVSSVIVKVITQAMVNSQSLAVGLKIYGIVIDNSFKFTVFQFSLQIVEFIIYLYNSYHV